MEGVKREKLCKKKGRKKLNSDYDNHDDDDDDL